MSDEVVTKAERQGLPTTVRRRSDGWVRAVSVAAFLLLWELAARTFAEGVLFVVPVTAILGDLWAWISSGEIVPHARASLIELVIGLALAIVIGLVVGTVMGLSRIAFQILDPLVSALYSTPLIALTPLFIVWLGIGLVSKIALVLLVAIFPIIYNVTAGMREVDKTHLEVVRALGATGSQIIRKVRFPAALPYVVVGIRLAVARAIVAVFVAELVGSTAGIGFSITRASRVFDAPRMFSGVMLLALSGVVASSLLTKLEHRLAPWRRQRG